MSEWEDWNRMRKVIPCAKPGCNSRAYSDTGMCAKHSSRAEQSAEPDKD